ncbi:hypothetical protein AM629_06475 [Photorhabdus heterorhabditis]|uniref:Uncharacterized protein n=1 Tax=Photorhabdus heterorhabditis TaxID=880156 RepID=A0ABR5KE09_9GAMM|nr:hypothetical protein AM629_06475 [Photorhabdus heterorhabditis]
MTINKNRLNDVPDIETRNQQRDTPLSRKARNHLLRTKEMFVRRGFTAIENEKIILAYLEENMPVDIASTFFDHRLKKQIQDSVISERYQTVLPACQNMFSYSQAHSKI